MSNSIYQTGGNLDPRSPSYIARAADHEILATLLGGEFCYMLDSRQVGKSSLMVRTALELQENGVRVSVVDLQSIGKNVTEEQWYGGMLYAIGKPLGLDEQLESAYAGLERLSPFQRWVRVFNDVVLESLGKEARLVIFVDEIDIVGSLKFNTDEFFLGIREMHNRRSLDPRLKRLTFCLLGSAAPADLITDPQVTPFNIGRRIELQDFTLEEAMPLAAGLSYAGSFAVGLLKLVLFWTGGHPYLTQQLCSSCFLEKAITQNQVDEICKRQFLSESARDSDPNLTYVRDRLLKGSKDPSSVLLTLRTIRGKALVSDLTNEAQSVIRLSGIVRVVDQKLKIRNEIYRIVFDDNWINAGLPEREQLRERAAEESVKLKVKRSTKVVLGVAAVCVVVIAIAIAAGIYSQKAKFASNEAISLSNIKQLDLALIMYTNDYDDEYPITMEMPAVQEPLQIYTKDTSVFSDAWGKQFQGNIALSQFSGTRILYPEDTIIFYQSWSPDGQTRAVAFADGHAKNFPEEQFFSTLQKSDPKHFDSPGGAPPTSTTGG